MKSIYLHYYNLDITDIVICGHSNCAAIKSCEDSIYQSLPDGLKNWIGIIKSQLDLSANYTDLNQAIRQNVLNQMANLKKYPDVQKKLAMGTLNIHAWFFNFNQSMIYEWDANKQSFDSLVNEEKLLLPG
ncbi:MAG: carbonic anhydrase [Gammaproteobacteria bacterium]